MRFVIKLSNLGIWDLNPPAQLISLTNVLYQSQSGPFTFSQICQFSHNPNFLLFLAWNIFLASPHHLPISICENIIFL